MPLPAAEPAARAFRHCPGCGAPLPAAPRDARLLACAACGFHYHFNPAIGTGAILFAPDGRILLTRRLHEPGQGLLGLPGGFVDAGEGAEQALRREIREEVGLDVPEAAFSYLCSGVNLYPYRGILYSVLDFFFTARLATTATAQPLDEVASILWAHPAEIDLAAVAFPTVRAALERCRS